MPPSESQSGPGRRVVPIIAVLAILGLILAVLITSCAGGDDDPSEAVVTSQQATAAEAESVLAEEGTQETTPVETETAEAEPVDAETATTTDGTETTAEDTSGGEVLPGTIVDAAVEAGSFATLLGLLERSTLDTTLSGDGPFTLFAPTDDAFEALPDEVLAALDGDPTALEQLLTYHVVTESVSPDALEPGSLPTVEGTPLEISERLGELYAADAPILDPTAEAGNGWLYPIGYVLLPPDLDLAALVGDEAAAAAYDRADFVVFFESGSAELDAAAQQTVSEAAAEVEALPADSRVRLVGVADPTGDAAANLELSRDRARAVQAALELAAPGADVRYVVRANGEEEGPELANARRVDIVLIPG